MRKIGCLIAAAAFGMAATGCARMSAEERAADPSMSGAKESLAQFPGAEQQIRNYYEAHAQEGNDTCGDVDMGPILRTSELANTADQLKLAVHYEFSSEDGGGRSQYCKGGFNTRIVTLKKSGGVLSLESMSGELHDV